MGEGLLSFKVPITVMKIWLLLNSKGKKYSECRRDTLRTCSTKKHDQIDIRTRIFFHLKLNRKVS